MSLMILMKNRKINTPTATKTFEDWYKKLDNIPSVKVTKACARIETGNLGDVKSVGQGVFEYRITFGPGYRIYFAWDGDEHVILLCGGTKKRQSTDIKQARAILDDYKRNKDRNRKGGRN